MSRAGATVLGNQAFGDQLTQYVVDPTFGGQNGFVNDISTFINNQAYVSKQVVAVVMEAPGFFNLLPDSNKWVEILRSFFETHVRSIEGLHSGIEAEFEEHPVGGANEVQHEVVNTRRTQSTPTVSVVEKYGLPYQNFFRSWIQYGMMDPDAKYALAALIGNYQGPWTADMYTATVLFFEPDPAFKRVTKAWLCANMMPHTNGEEDGRRDLTAAGELLTHSIEFTAITQTGSGVRALAQSMLDLIQQSNPNPYTRQAFIQDQDSDVAASQVSYANTIANLSNEQVAGPVSP